MKKKSSPFKGSLIGGALILSIFSFFSFVIGIVIYKSIFRETPEEKGQEISVVVPEDITPDTVLIKKTDTVFVIKAPVQLASPAVVPSVTPKIKIHEKEISHKDTKNLKSPIEESKKNAPLHKDTLL